MAPTLVLSYVLYGLFLLAVQLFAHPALASAVFHDGPVLLALFLFATRWWPLGDRGRPGGVRTRERSARRPTVGGARELPIIAVVLLMRWRDHADLRSRGWCSRWGSWSSMCALYGSSLGCLIASDSSPGPRRPELERDAYLPKRRAARVPHVDSIARGHSIVE